MVDIERYAEVALGVASGKRFHYRIPASMCQEISLGQAVLVPLGRRFIVGHVVDFPMEVPDIPLKDIQQVLRGESSLDGHLIQLTRQVADYYLSPWGEVIRSALPPPSRSLCRWVFHLSSRSSIPAVLSPLETRIWGALSDASPLSLSQLRSRVGDKDVRIALERMLKKGWLLREMIPVKGREARTSVSPFGPSPLIPSANEGEEWKDEWLSLQALIERPAHRVFMILEASRKERARCYLQIIHRFLERGKGVLFLVPEIHLIPSWLKEFQGLYSDHIAVLHSDLSPKERGRQWRRLQGGEALIGIGTRSAVFAPHTCLGLILVEEEHDPAYKEERGCSYHAREVALMRAAMLKIPLILASCAPSVESYHNSLQGKYQSLLLPGRDKGASPCLTLVDTQKEGGYKGRPPLISASLKGAIERSLSASQQAILLINRRGSFTHLLCRECGFNLQCPQCSVPMVLHKGRGRLICHRCGREEDPPDHCPSCRGSIIQFFGPGTQRLEEEIRHLFPMARISRMDQDSFSSRARSQEILERFRKGDIDILVGTRMAIRALQLGRASLLALLATDNLLSLPDFRAGEHLFHLMRGMIQMGREKGRPSEILIQTQQPGHYVLQALQTGDDLLFYHRELTSRKILSLPPFLQLVLIECSAKREERAKGAALTLASLLRSASSRSLHVEGPAPAPLPRQRGKFHWRLLVKGPQGELVRPMTAALEGFQGCDAQEGISLRWEIDPLRFF